MALSQLNKRQQGQVYEAMAERFLQRHHLSPVTRNFQCRSGEIDLIMRDGDCWVFVEVKYRKQIHFGSPAEAVNWRKQQKLKRAALFWLQKNGLSSEHTAFRFDVVAIQGPDHQIEWFTNILVEG
ncbi:YraN family protein [Photobacterium sp.]|uniref:YraN family protein n=1 Tax=Photobacterium sp. TaxID=660 RepID=UPI00299F19D5|nr:YraN family protein [Photobacterium sp.]MDX1303843.1 YraN family protein [Photobacterium sp.]